MTAALSVSMVAAALMSFSMMTAASSVVPFPVMAALRIRIIRKLSLGKHLSSLIRIHYFSLSSLLYILVFGLLTYQSLRKYSAS